MMYKFVHSDSYIPEDVRPTYAGARATVATVGSASRLELNIEFEHSFGGSVTLPVMGDHV